MNIHVREVNWKRQTLSFVNHAVSLYMSEGYEAEPQAPWDRMAQLREKLSCLA